MKFFLLYFLLSISFSSYSKDPSGQTVGLGYSTSNVQHINSYLVVSFVDKVNLACKTRDKELFFDIFSNKVLNKKNGVRSFKKDHIEHFISLICSQLNSSTKWSGYKINFFKNPNMYEYGILDFKKRRDSPEDEPVWFTRLCVYKNDLCILSIQAVIEKDELRLDEK